MNIKQIGEAIEDLRNKVNTLLTGSNKVNAEQFEAAQADWKTRLEELSGKLADIAQTNEVLSTENSGLKEQVEDLTGQMAAQAEEHKVAIQKKETEVDAKAGKKASSIAAAQGVAVIPVKTDSSSADKAESLEEVREKLRTEKDPVKKRELAIKAREMRGHKDIFTYSRVRN